MTQAPPPPPRASVPDAPSTPSAPAAGDPASSVRTGSHVVIIGGGPGGYEAATVAARMGARVTLVERRGLGGSAVLTDVVPSKTLIATSEWAARAESATELGISTGTVGIDMALVNTRVRGLAASQSTDIRGALEQGGVRVVDGVGRPCPDIDRRGRRLVLVTGARGTGPDSRPDGTEEVLADIVLVATGASPRHLPTARPDGERILDWTQLYRLSEVPSHLVVVGSGVTGAEFAGAFLALGSRVTLVSSRERVLPGEDADAAAIVEGVFERRGMTILSRSRAAGVVNTGGGVRVDLTDGRSVEGSHCLMAVGAVPNTGGLGLEEAGVELTPSGHVRVDRVSRTTAPRVYAAGDCTGVLPLASVAAQQGRIAMWHALGDTLEPLDVSATAQAVFTSPEVAQVGASEEAARAADPDARVASLPLARNPRAKMQGVVDGFVKIIASGAGVVIGGVVVGPGASDLVFPLTLAVRHRLTVDQLSGASTIYPSISGTISEVARILH